MPVASMPIQAHAQSKTPYVTLKLHNIEILTGIFPEETGAKGCEP